MGVPSGSLLWLGLPTTVSHTIDAGSPLQGLMPEDMAALDMEVLVLLDGIDASTSGHVQARYADAKFFRQFEHRASTPEHVKTRVCRLQAFVVGCIEPGVDETRIKHVLFVVIRSRAQSQHRLEGNAQEYGRQYLPLHLLNQGQFLDICGLSCPRPRLEGRGSRCCSCVGVVPVFPCLNLCFSCGFDSFECHVHVESRPSPTQQIM